MLTQGAGFNFDLLGSVDQNIILFGTARIYPFDGMRFVPFPKQFGEDEPGTPAGNSASQTASAASGIQDLVLLPALGVKDNPSFPRSMRTVWPERISP